MIDWKIENVRIERLKRLKIWKKKNEKMKIENLEKWKIWKIEKLKTDWKLKSKRWEYRKTKLEKLKKRPSQ